MRAFVTMRKKMLVKLSRLFYNIIKNEHNICGGQYAG